MISLLQADLFCEVFLSRHPALPSRLDWAAVAAPAAAGTSPCPARCSCTGRAAGAASAASDGLVSWSHRAGCVRVRVTSPPGAQPRALAACLVPGSEPRNGRVTRPLASDLRGLRGLRAELRPGRHAALRNAASPPRGLLGSSPAWGRVACGRVLEVRAAASVGRSLSHLPRLVLVLASSVGLESSGACNQRTESGSLKSLFCSPRRSAHELSLPQTHGARVPAGPLPAFPGAEHGALTPRRSGSSPWGKARPCSRTERRLCGRPVRRLPQNRPAGRSCTRAMAAGGVRGAASALAERRGRSVRRRGAAAVLWPVCSISGTRLAHPAPLRDFISKSQPNEAVPMETVALVPVATSWGFTPAEGEVPLLPVLRAWSCPVLLSADWGAPRQGLGSGGPGCRSGSFAGRRRCVPSPLPAQAAAPGARCGGWGHRPDAVGGTRLGSRLRGLCCVTAHWTELGPAISRDAGALNKLLVTAEDLRRRFSTVQSGNAHTGAANAEPQSPAGGSGGSASSLGARAAGGLRSLASRCLRLVLPAASVGTGWRLLVLQIRCTVPVPARNRSFS